MSRCRAKTRCGNRCTRSGPHKGYCWQHEGIHKQGLKDRGWTDAGIRDFLGDPDRTRPNPFNSLIPIKIWRLRRVESVERTEEWRQWYEASLKRRKSAKKAVETRSEALLNEIEEWEPKILVEARRTVEDWALEHYNSRNRRYRPVDRSAGQEFLKRVTVNFLRHKCSDYESTLRRIKGRAGTDEAYNVVKRKTLDRIAEEYPWLREECERQIDGLSTMETHRSHGT